MRPPFWQLAVFVLALAWSAIAPADRFTWWLEIAPALIALAALALTYRRFRFTGMAYTLILLQCIILFIGGHYTYAKVPAFDWIRDAIGGTRNNFDKLAHFAQGFVPAAVVREVFVRLGVVRGKGWLAFTVISVCLAISAAYELLEWGVSEATGSAGDAFLGTQGYVWDTQSDMAMALVGAGAFVFLFGRVHDARIRALPGTTTQP